MHTLGHLPSEQGWFFSLGLAEEKQKIMEGFRRNCWTGQMNTSLHQDVYPYIHIYIYMCVCVCVCMCLFSLFVKQSSGTGIIKNPIPKLCKFWHLGRFCKLVEREALQQSKWRWKIYKSCSNLTCHPVLKICVKAAHKNKPIQKNNQKTPWNNMFQANLDFSYVHIDRVPFSRPRGWTPCETPLSRDSTIWH